MYIFYLEIVLPLYQVRDAFMLVGDGVGDKYFIFYPVSIFRKAHPFHVLRIVRIVVDGSHGTQLVEAFDKHSFGIHVGETQRTGDVGHSTLLTPLFDSADQGICHFGVVGKVDPSETDFPFVPGLVGPIVDDGGHTTY